MGSQALHIVQTPTRQEEAAALQKPFANARPAPSEAAESAADDSERSKRKRSPNWKGKPEVLEQINELIAELDGIAASIAGQVGNCTDLGAVRYVKA